MPSITIDKQFFRKSLDDYQDWKTAQPRELLQNSVDCGSSNIEFTVDEDENGHVRLSCYNDGPAMTKDILVGKFMALGGTTKGQDGSVGGFGIAKLVIACAHQSYVIHTGGLVLTGEGGQYELEEDAEYLSGTRTTVVLWPDYYTRMVGIIQTIKNVVTRSDIKQSVTVNGETVADRLVPSGGAIQSFDFGNVHVVDQDDMEDSMIVRVGGLFMFSSYVKTKRSVVLELTDSKKLTSNRDGLTWSCRDKVEKYVNDLAINNETNLMIRTPEVTEYGDYDIAHAIEELDALIRSIEEKLPESPDAESPDAEATDAGLPDAKLGEDTISSGAPDCDSPEDTTAPRGETKHADVLQFGDAPGQAKPAGGPITGDTEYQSIAGAEAAYGHPTGQPGGSPVGSRRVVAIARKMAKIVVSNHTKIQLPDYCIPGGLSKGMRKTMADWSGACLASASLLRIDERFSIGYVVSDAARALWMHTSSGHVLLFNPFEIVKIGTASWTLKNKGMSIEEMMPLAIHEITHMQLRSKYHDEVYACSLTDNMGRAYAAKKSLEKRTKEISKIMYNNFIW